MIDAIATEFVAGIAVGLVSALATAGRYAYSAAQAGEESLRLLKGSEEIEGDGVIEIVEENRTISRANRQAIEKSDAVPSPHKYE